MSTFPEEISIIAYDRINRARNLESVLAYDVQQSEQHHIQQQGVDWLRYSTKQRFDEALAQQLTRWGGVSVHHIGSCVLSPVG